MSSARNYSSIVTINAIKWKVKGVYGKVIKTINFIQRLSNDYQMYKDWTLWFKICENKKSEVMKCINMLSKLSNAKFCVLLWMQTKRLLHFYGVCQGFKHYQTNAALIQCVESYPKCRLFMLKFLQSPIEFLKEFIWFLYTSRSQEYYQIWSQWLSFLVSVLRLQIHSFTGLRLYENEGLQYNPLVFRTNICG